MARRATGQVVERERKAGRVFALRFRAYGKRRYITLDTAPEWNRERAEERLRHVLADVERGIWTPHERLEHQEPEPEPTFHEFASEWFGRREADWRPHTQADYRWALTYHLLPWFQDYRLSEITIEEVDRYAAAKQREGLLSNNSINKTLTRLSQILEDAFEYGKIARNPARGKRRRLKGEQRSRPWVEPEQLLALLDAADPYSRPVFATLAGTGMRPGEAIGLRWRDVNLATSTISIRESKTDAGVRQVDVPIGTAEALRELRARSAEAGLNDPVFVNSKGRRQTKRNLQERLKTAIKRANVELRKAAIEPLSSGVTPYAFRRTYSSLRASRWVDAEGRVRPGDDPIYIAEQMGHTDPKFTFRVYQRAVKRRERLSGAHLDAFDRALQWAAMGTNGAEGPAPYLPDAAPQQGLRG